MIDTLLQRIDELKNPSVVGLDPNITMIPDKLREQKIEQFGKTPKAVAEMFFEFNKEIIDAVADIVPAVKPQIAMYEQYALAGIDVYLRTVEYAKEKGMIVIGDIKRGDISSTAKAYAAHIGGTDIFGENTELWKEDFVTVNPYLGIDGILPFVEACNERDKGIFVLVKTSNPSGVQLQDLISAEKPIYQHVAELVKKWGELSRGKLGYDKVGAVVGATSKEQGEELRKLMPRTFFLVPGYGAQGGKGEDLKGYFDNEGRGCIVNSSRGIIAAYQKDAKYADDFAAAARDAAIAMREDLRF
ncbi:MAG: orotidine-5'-phosphate decarboxylase [Eubacteriales bacterium]